MYEIKSPFKKSIRKLKSRNQISIFEARKSSFEFSPLNFDFRLWPTPTPPPLSIRKTWVASSSSFSLWCFPDSALLYQWNHIIITSIFCTAHIWASLPFQKKQITQCYSLPFGGKIHYMSFHYMRFNTFWKEKERLLNLVFTVNPLLIPPLK